MGIVYQITCLVSLGLLGIVVAIFVLAVTQVGRATESASREQQNKMLQKKEVNLKQIEVIQGQLEKAKEAGKIDESELSKELEKTKEELKSYDNEIKRIQERVVMIRRKGAVIYPGACFILALALSLASSGLAESQNLLTLALWLWIISIGILIFGMYRVFRTLGAIEEVTITSGEAVDKLPEAVKSALRELEEEKKPELELEFTNEKPPFSYKVGEERAIVFGTRVTKGTIARNASVVFFAPPGFDFPGMDKAVQSKDIARVGGYLTAYFNFERCTRPIKLSEEIRIKAPNSAGKYILLYRISCDEGFDSDYNSFEVIVS